MNFKASETLKKFGATKQMFNGRSVSFGLKQGLYKIDVEAMVTYGKETRGMKKENGKNSMLQK